MIIKPHSTICITLQFINVMRDIIRTTNQKYKYTQKIDQKPFSIQYYTLYTQVHYKHNENNNPHKITVRHPRTRTNGQKILEYTNKYHKSNNIKMRMIKNTNRSTVPMISFVLLKKDTLDQ